MTLPTTVGADVTVLVLFMFPALSERAADGAIAWLATNDGRLVVDGTRQLVRSVASRPFLELHLIFLHRVRLTFTVILLRIRFLMTTGPIRPLILLMYMHPCIWIPFALALILTVVRRALRGQEKLLGLIAVDFLTTGLTLLGRPRVENVV